MSRPRFEVCLEGVDGVVAAHAGGADRVELCAALVEGGITPSFATIADSVRIDIPVMVMIRPRGGDFDYGERELKVMEDDIRACRDLGVAGVVFGVLDRDGSIAVSAVRRLISAAGPLAVTFHRAFDVCRDPMGAMEVLHDLGVRRILTSGQQAGVPEGLALIRRLIESAPAELTIMPGCGITPGNLRKILQDTGAVEFHATAFARQQSNMRHRNPAVFMGIPGLPEYERQVTSAAKVAEMVLIANNSGGRNLAF